MLTLYIFTNIKMLFFVITYIYLIIHKLFILYYTPTLLNYKILKKKILTVSVEFFVTNSPKSVKMGRKMFFKFDGVRYAAHVLF
jgi:hypothetical protein